MVVSDDAGLGEPGGERRQRKRQRQAAGETHHQDQRDARIAINSERRAEAAHHGVFRRCPAVTAAAMRGVPPSRQRPRDQRVERHLGTCAVMADDLARARRADAPAVVRAPVPGSGRRGSPRHRGRPRRWCRPPCRPRTASITWSSSPAIDDRALFASGSAPRSGTGRALSAAPRRSRPPDRATGSRPRWRTGYRRGLRPGQEVGAVAVDAERVGQRQRDHVARPRAAIFAALSNACLASGGSHR